MKAFLLGNAVLALVLAVAGFSCEPPAYDPPRLVPMTTAYPPLSVAPVTTQARMRADVESVPTPTTLPLVGPDTPCQQWLPLAIDMGWPADRVMAERLLSIMWRESRCNYDSWYKLDPNGGSLGLLQINQFWCKPNRYTDNGYLQDVGVLDKCEELFDPATNLRAGLALYSYSVYKNGDGWHPWRT